MVKFCFISVKLCLYCIIQKMVVRNFQEASIKLQLIIPNTKSKIRS